MGNRFTGRGNPDAIHDWNTAIGGDAETVAKELASKKAAEAFLDEDGPIQEASYDSGQAVELCKNDLNFLAATAMPTVFEVKFPPVLLAAWDLLLKLVFQKGIFPQLALGIPRGHGKTTLIKLFVLYCILFTNKKFILVVGATASMAENVVADIFDFLNEPNIKALFGSWRMGMEMDRQDLKKFGFRGRNIIVAAIGAEGTLRGLNLKNERPDVMIFEDIQSAECAESPLQAASLERWMIGTAMKAKSPRGCMTIFCGNMFPGPNSILKKLKGNKNWISFTTGAILSDYTALWPELISLQSLLDELDNDISMGHPEIFFSEKLNETDIAINTRIDLSSMGEWRWSDLDIPQGKLLIIDPGTGKANGDATAIARVEIYDETPGVREVIEEVFSPGATILKALLLCLNHGIRCIGIESTAYQSTLKYWFERETERLQITGIHAVELYNTQSSKNSRISMMLKGVSAKEILLHPSIRTAFIHQVANWNPLKRDNVDGILDTITYIQRAMEQYPELIASEETLITLESGSIVVSDDNHAF